MNIILSNKYIYANVKIDDILQLWQVHKSLSQIDTRSIQFDAKINPMNLSFEIFSRQNEILFSCV